MIEKQRKIEDVIYDQADQEMGGAGLLFRKKRQYKELQIEDVIKNLGRVSEEYIQSLTPEYRDIALQNLRDKLNNVDKKEKKYKKKSSLRNKHTNSHSQEPTLKKGPHLEN